LALVLLACGSGDEQVEPAPDTGDEAQEALEDAEEALEDLPEDPEELADDAREQAEEAQEASGGGQAELTIGEETWTFDSLVCAFGPEEIGDPEAEFVLSAIQDGLQLYVSIDGFGHSVSLDDVDDFENPSVGWTAGGPVTALAGDGEEFIQVDGTEVQAEAEFVDSRDGMSSESAPGSLVATCP